jgi:hypothetical protein
MGTKSIPQNLRICWGSVCCPLLQAAARVFPNSESESSKRCKQLAPRLNPGPLHSAICRMHSRKKRTIWRCNWRRYSTSAARRLKPKRCSSSATKRRSLRACSITRKEFKKLLSRPGNASRLPELIGAVRRLKRAMSAFLRSNVRSLPNQRFRVKR